MIILENKLVAKNKEHTAKISGGAKIIYLGLSLLAAAAVGIYTIGYKSEERLSERWKQEIRQIASDRQNGFYESADLRIFHIAEEIRDYECNREKRNTFKALSLRKLDVIKDELRHAQALTNTNILQGLD
ncbi:MAG: hypothetical protein AABX07_03000 [Nanoarchaeota archaeon]